MEYLFFPDFGSIRADSCGMAILSPGWRHHRRKMDVSVLILGAQGEIDLVEEGSPLRVEPGRFTLLASGRTHEGQRPCREKVRYFWLHFESKRPPVSLPEEEARRILENRGIAASRLSDALLLPASAKLRHAAVLREEFQSLLSLQEEGSFTPHTFQLRSKLLLLSFNEAVLESLSGPDQRGPSSLVGLMIQYIHENLSDSSCSVKSLAWDLGYNPDYLNRHFREMMSVTLKDYILDRRIALATRYLTDSSRPIADIVSAAGFATYRNFVRQFLERTGLRPSEYRRRYSQMHITN